MDWAQPAVDFRPLSRLRVHTATTSVWQWRLSSSCDSLSYRLFKANKASALDLSESLRSAIFRMFQKLHFLLTASTSQAGQPTPQLGVESNAARYAQLKK